MIGPFGSKVKQTSWIWGNKSHGSLCAHNMMASSNVNFFRVTDHLCGELTGPGEFPVQRPVTQSFDVFFDLRLNKRLRKQSWGWWFETLSRPLWRHCNEYTYNITEHQNRLYISLWNMLYALPAINARKSIHDEIHDSVIQRISISTYANSFYCVAVFVGSVSSWVDWYSEMPSVICTIPIDSSAFTLRGHCVVTMKKKTTKI